MIVALYVILGVYLLLIGSFIFGFYRLNTFYPQRTPLNVCFSVIIPFRNEEQHLPKLLSSIVQLDYPKQTFECIFVDDDSNDDSVPLIQRYLTNTGIDFKIIKSLHLPKKMQSRRPFIKLSSTGSSLLMLIVYYHNNG